MRTIEEYKNVLKLKNEGYNHCQISRLVGIPRETIQGWINYPPKNFVYWGINQPNVGYLRYWDGELKDKIQNDQDYKKLYSYILGLYLGDGCIDMLARTIRLRIFVDAKYNLLNDLIENSLRRFFYKSKINRNFHGTKTCVCFSVSCVELKNLFPQIGRGVKHNRKIELVDWQKENISYAELLMGLIHSDGCCYFSGGRRNFGFSNRSGDIHDIFQTGCDFFGIRFTISRKNNQTINTNINKRKDVEKLYYIVGSKTKIIPFLDQNESIILNELNNIDNQYLIKLKKKKIPQPKIHKERKKHFCPNCNKEINRRSKYCEACWQIKERKVERPTYDVLMKEIQDTSYCAVGRKYGVSDNAIRKWIKKYPEYLEFQN